MKYPISIKDLDFSYDDQNILKAISLNFEKGRLYSILGPNGSGKTTLIKNISGILSAKMSSIYINGTDIIHLRGKEMARLISVVPQNSNVEYEFSVYDVVMMGRNPYKKRFEGYDDEDEAIVRQSMEITNTWIIKDKLITELSGGEVQRVTAARALTQQTDIILLDEPTAHLDLQYQLEFLNIFSKIKQDKIIIAVLHDLNLASYFSDHMIFIKKGQIIEQGTPEAVMKKGLIKNIYNIDVEIIKSPVSGAPFIIY